MPCWTTALDTTSSTQPSLSSLSSLKWCVKAPTATCVCVCNKIKIFYMSFFRRTSNHSSLTLWITFTKHLNPLSMFRPLRAWKGVTNRKKTDRVRDSTGEQSEIQSFYWCDLHLQEFIKKFSFSLFCYIEAKLFGKSVFFPSRYRRDARSLDEDEEMWFNDDEDDEDGESTEKRMEDDFSDSYGKFMETKKGKLHWQKYPEEPFLFFVDCNFISIFISAGAANGANGANNGKAAAIPPSSPVVTPNSSPSSSVKTVALPPTCVVKVILFKMSTRSHCYLLLKGFLFLSILPLSPLLS